LRAKRPRDKNNFHEYLDGFLSSMILPMSSDAEEQAIADLVTVHSLMPANLFTEATFQHIAMQAFLEKYQDSENPPQFDHSPRFITGFKMRNGFSSRRAHFNWRSNVIDGKQAWIDKLAQLLRDVPDHARTSTLTNHAGKCTQAHYEPRRCERHKISRSA
jgi:hypothetical protein